MPATVAKEQTLEERRIAEQKQEMRARLIEGSFGRRCRPLLTELKLDQSIDFDGELNAAIAKHNSEADALAAEFDGIDKQVSDAVNGAVDSADPTSILSAVEGVRIDRPLLLQRTLKAWVVAGELTSRMAAAIKPLVAPAETKANAVLETVKKQLCEIGCGPEATQAGRHGQPIFAARQFAHLARYGNTKSTTAFDLASDLRNKHQSLERRAREAKRRLDEARIFVNDQTLKSIGS